jgi:MFS family permease|nr:MFS transporter [Candidatus Delongbacteria bacterium]
MLASKLIATAFLFIIAMYPAFWILIPLYVIRGALMNSAQPLSRSILMDAVPKKHRGKWSSVSVISWGLFWNASAMIGGFLIGEDNFQLCFLVTACVYAVGSIPLFFLIPLVNKEI